MSLSLLKAGAVAAAIAIAAVPAVSLAAPMLYGTIDYTTKLKYDHNSASPTITWVHDGDDVTVVGAWGSWFKVKVQRPGPDPVGWVKKSAVDLDYGPGPGPYPGPSPTPGVQACFNGPMGYFCINQ